MAYYPVSLDIEGRPCLVIGGGAVAGRKVVALLKARASVTVISPALCAPLKELGRRGDITYIERKYEEGDLDGVVLVVAATGSGSINRAVSREANSRAIPVNVVDKPALCSFIVPAVVERGDLTIAVSTGGKIPYLAREIRKELEESYGDEYGVLVELVGAVRNKILKEGRKDVKKDKIYKALIGSEVLGWISAGDRRNLNALLRGLLGDGYSLSRLGVRIKD